MATITEYFEQAQLSLAAYALNLTPGISGTAYTGKLEAAGMSSPQAENFATTYSVVDQFTDPLTGFSATVFDKTGIKYFAIRGTEGLFSFSGAVDWLNNVADVGAEGIAIRQGLALLNYLQRLQGAAGNPVVQYAYDSLTRTIITTTGTANGWLSGQQVSVTGHSLGGHLAIMMSRLAPDMMNAVYTYNAPGFDTALRTNLFPLTSEGFFNTLRAAPIGPITGPIGTAWNSGIMTQWYVQGDVVHGIGSTPGSQGIVFSENTNQGVVDAHDIKAITDSLAIYDLFAEIDSSLNTADPAVGIGKVTDILKAASNNSSDTLERTVNALVNFFGLEFAPLAGALIDNRDVLYQRVVQLQTVTKNLAANSTLQVDSLVTISASGLANLAQGSEALAYRYALKELNPFAIVGNNALYDAYNQNGELDLYNRVTGQGTLTAAYLADRATMLGWKNQDFTADGQRTLRGSRTETYQFIDKTLKDTFGNDLTFTVRGSQPGSVGNPAKVIFGGDAADLLVGGNVNAGDRLYGGGDDDTLQGNQGNDYLEGGKGNDTYVWNTGDGFDTVLDTDGIGKLVIDGKVVSGGIKVAQGDYVNAENLALHFEGDPVAGGVLIVNGDLKIENFTSGKLGIVLNDQGNFAEIQPTTRMYFGDSLSFPEDILQYGSDGNDHFIAGSGISTFFGKSGDDLLEGHGFDYLRGGAGYDIVSSGVYDEFALNIGENLLSGGAGADIILGGVGNENIFGDMEQVTIDLEETGFFYIDGLSYDGSSGSGQFDNPGVDVGFVSEEPILFAGGFTEALDYVLGISESTNFSTLYDDFIDGGEGNDLIDSGLGSDTVFGGNGSDVILDDFFRPKIRGETNTEAILSLFGTSGDDYLDGGDGNDRLTDAGGGYDVLIGGSGDDFFELYDRSLDGFTAVDGGTGNDTIRVSWGAAHIEGGAGSDNYFISPSSSPVPVTINNYDVSPDRLDSLYLPSSLWPGLPSSNLTITRDDVNLYIGFAGIPDLISIEHWFEATGYKLNQIVFGTQPFDLDVAEIESRFTTATATADFLWGSATDDQLAGGAGNDTLFGNTGKDVLAGNEGNDTLDGGEGADIYAFYIGDGVDHIFDTGDFDTDGIAFGPGITSDMLTLGLGSLLINVGAGGDAIHLDGFDPDDARNSSNIEYFQFTDGVTLTYQQLLDRGFDLIGTDTDDVLTGTSVNDRIRGFGGNDTLDGRAGEDMLEGGSGSDAYLFARGSGRDLVEDLDIQGSDVDSIVLDTEITAENLMVTRSGDILTLKINGTADELAIRWDPAVGYGVERMQFADGTVWDATMLESKAGTGNTAPVLSAPLADQTAQEDALFTSPVRDGSFSDSGDVLSFSAVLADGTVLPGWLSFDPATATFNGTPTNDDVGAFDVTVTATDMAGLSASDTFQLMVTNTNDAPVLSNPVVNQYIADGDALQFQLAENIFNDIDAGDTLSYAAAQADGAPLPAWLAFDAVTRTFSGIPDEADIGTLSLSVTATDASSATASDSFDLNVTVAPDKALVGTGDDDVLAARSGNDTLDGLAGDDALFGRSGSDRLSGGLGDDLLVGGKGNDTYVYRPGDGLDMVADEAGSDAVAFGIGLTRANVVARMSEDDSTARVRVLDSYGNEQANQGLDVALGIDGQSPIEWFTFADGDSASLDDLLIRKEVHTGTRRNDVIRTGRNDDTIYADRGNDVVYAGSGHDMLFGDRGRDVLYGEAGNDALVGDRGKDKLYGGSGDDMLEGGRGSDLLDGGTGFNTYMFERGFGDDRIASSGGSGAVRFGAGITARDLSFKRRDNDLVVKVHDAGRIRIEGWFDPKAAHPVERAEFADGTVLNADKFVAKGYDYEREGDEDDDDDDVGSHYAHDDDRGRPRGAANDADHEDVHSAKTHPSRGKSGEVPDNAWFERVVEKWNAHSGRPDTQNDDAHGDTQRHARYTNRWQRMHSRLNAHLAGGEDDGNDGGADLASLKPGFARGLAFTQFGPIGYGGVGVEDRGAADLRPFTGLKEGLARIA